MTKNKQNKPATSPGRKQHKLSGIELRKMAREEARKAADRLNQNVQSRDNQD